MAKSEQKKMREQLEGEKTSTLIKMLVDDYTMAYLKPLVADELDLRIPPRKKP